MRLRDIYETALQHCSEDAAEKPEATSQDLKWASLTERVTVSFVLTSLPTAFNGQSSNSAKHLANLN